MPPSLEDELSPTNSAFFPNPAAGVVGVPISRFQLVTTPFCIRDVDIDAMCGMSRETWVTTPVELDGLLPVNSRFNPWGPERHRQMNRTTAATQASEVFSHMSGPPVAY